MTRGGNVFKKSKELFDYYYYRITKFYLTSRYRGYRFYNTRICGGLSFQLLSLLFMSLLICPLSAILRVDLISRQLFWWKNNTPAAWIVIVFWILGEIYGNESRFQTLSLQYCNELNSKAKGWLIAGIILAVILLFIFALWAFIRPLHVASGA